MGASEVCFELDKTSVSHSLNSVNRQIFQLTSSSIMPRTINEQILYIIGTFFAVKEIQARVIYSYSAVIKAVQRRYHERTRDDDAITG